LRRITQISKFQKIYFNGADQDDSEEEQGQLEEPEHEEQQGKTSTGTEDSREA
jgi:hypothetical protein